ncbi:MAG: YcjF family protein [Deltaproteobacteria bacterium]|nr:YcjF family protein [Deltaproteobacteria bacterium]
MLFINGNLASLAEAIHPGSLWWAHGALLCAEATALFLFWRGVAGGHKHLLLLDDAGPEAGERFAKELARRMRSNPHVREAGVTPDGPDDAAYIAECMALLRAKADEEIERNAKRIFLATALSHNGRLDALIVFFSLCRLVWRIAAIYNQRPHPREIASLYWTVVTSTFLALSLEELDLTTEISAGFGQAFHVAAPAGLTASIPFAGKALQTFTAAAIDGALNCFLALRAGIIARNAYDYAFAGQPRPSRTDVYLEAGSVLRVMSASLMERLARGLTDALGEVVENARHKTVQAGQGVGRSIGLMGASVGHAATDAGASVAGAATNAVVGAARASRSGVNALGEVVESVRHKTVQTGKGIGRSIGRMGAVVGHAATDAGAAVAGAAANAVVGTARATRSAAKAVVGIAAKPFSWMSHKKG